MKTLEKLSNRQKGKLLADLLPEELPDIILFIEHEIQSLLENEQQTRSHWKPILLTANVWFQLVRSIEKAIQRYGSSLYKNHRCFARRLFDGYEALFTIYCLVEYSAKAECNHKLRQAIHLLFSEEKLILTTHNDNNKEWKS
jgi:hypothetical protein